MTAKLPPAVQQKIVARRNAGARINEIADELDLSRHTVANYCRVVDQGKALNSSVAPAAALSITEVARLREVARWLSLSPVELLRLVHLARLVRTRTCPACSSVTMTLTATEPPYCEKCGTSFADRRPRPTTRAQAAGESAGAGDRGIAPRFVPRPRQPPVRDGVDFADPDPY